MKVKFVLTMDDVVVNDQAIDQIIMDWESEIDQEEILEVSHKWITTQNFLTEKMIGLTKVGPPLRVAQDYVLAQLLEHRRRNLASVGSLFLPIHVLGAYLDLGGRHQLLYRCQGRRGRAQYPIHTLHPVQSPPDAAHKVDRLGDGQVHLPVSS